jgi:hypothetical protein
MPRLIQPYRRELDELYQRHLGRDIDATGYYHYAALLEDGVRTLEDIERILLDSDEYREHALAAAKPGCRDDI